MIDELRTDVTKTRTDGTLRYDYRDRRDPQAAIAWLWRYIDAAKSAGELYGRALVVIAAEQYATRLVVPSSQRMPATRWSSHKDIAAKALKKLAEPHVPASVTRLEQAVKRAHAFFGWLRVVAIHEAYRLSAVACRDLHLERLNVDEHDWEELIADSRTLEDAVTALEALRTLASLPERQRSDLTLKIAGYSYDEIRALTPGRTFTNLSKSLVKARARIRRARDPRQ